MKKKILICALILTTGKLLNAQDNTYYVGHSGFGWDLIVGEMVNDLATDATITTYDYNFQFTGGTCLSTQWVEHDMAQGGTDSWLELPNGYDHVVLAEQIPIEEVIYSSPWGCDLTSVEAVDNFYDLATGANPNAQIYLMEFHNEVDLTGPTPFSTWSQLNTDMRPLWEQVADSVALLNSAQICIVPVAAAFEAMADSVLAGSFPGITNWVELFDPNDLPQSTIHPTEITYYLVACVHFATIFKQSPVGLTNETFAAAGWQFDPPTPAQAQMMQEIAWEIVSNDPYTCISSAGTDEIAEESGFRIYPNPSNGQVNVVSNINLVELEIFNMSGKSVKKMVGGTHININLPQGVYSVQGIYSNGKHVIKRLIIN